MGDTHISNVAIFEAALVGLEHRRAELDRRIAEVKHLLNQEHASSTNGTSSTNGWTPERRAAAAVRMKKVAKRMWRKRKKMNTF